MVEMGRGLPIDHSTMKDANPAIRGSSAVCDQLIKVLQPNHSQESGDQLLCFSPCFSVSSREPAAVNRLAPQ